MAPRLRSKITRTNYAPNSRPLSSRPPLDDATRRRLCIFLASALGLFSATTFVLVGMLPAPSSTAAGPPQLPPWRHWPRDARNVRRRATHSLLDPRGSAPRTTSRAAGESQQGGRSAPKHEDATMRRQGPTPEMAPPDAGGGGGDEEGDPRIVHILETRFMQNQPDLVQLAMARLRLLATICLPTVMGQTVWGNFLWVIRTDPALAEEVKEELVRLLDEAGALDRGLTCVIGSNANYIVSNATALAPGVRPFDVRGMLGAALARPERLFAGTEESLRTLHDQVAAPRAAGDVFLWTRLDADDGLNVGYLAHVQDEAVRYFLPDRYEYELLLQAPPANATEEGAVAADGPPRYVPPRWSYWCAGKNIDWFLTDPVRDPHHGSGTVYPVVHLNVCVTPGVTVGLRGDVDPLSVPRLDHDKIISHLRRPGGGALCARAGRSVLAGDESPTAEEDDGTCFHLVTSGISAVRSRTPTSAGMLGVRPDAAQRQMVRLQPKFIPILWRALERSFRVDPAELRRTNKYFAKHVYDIAEENARGQCTAGHSCKTSSKDLLQQYVDLKSEMEGGLDVAEGNIVTADN